MATKSTVNTISYYTFGSPRYHSILNAQTILIPEDYSYHDSTLGTYDMNFPLYAINSTPIPKVELINQEGIFSNIKGAIAPFLGKSAYKTKTIGKSGTRSIPTNSNLDSKEVKYDEYLHSKLNPGWCVIQNYNIAGNDNTPEYLPRFIVRILGNTSLSNQLYALELQESALGALHTTFPAGFIVTYKGNLWKCVADTSTYPPSKTDEQTDFWVSLYNRINVFNADIFAITNDNVQYFMEINDDNRTFNSIIQDDTLVSWNLAYWQE